MKAALYCRLSEEDRNKQNKNDDSNSIQNQKTMLTQYAVNQGWDIFDIYSDDDYTGSDRHRPQFNRLLEDARQNKFEIILCKTQSRFTRELELVEKYIHGLFPVWGIRFVSIVDNADTNNKGNKKSRQINGLVNEWYLEDMSENIRSVLTARRSNGFHIGAFALYGYLKDPMRKGHLIIDEEAATVVREVFALFSQGYGKTAIARILNDRGIPNPTEYKRLHGLRYQHPSHRNSTLWKYSAISDMLTNEIYIGNMVQGKYGSISYKSGINKPRPKDQWIIVEGTHEPIIQRELWDCVQGMLAERAKPFGNGQIGLFAGKVKCAYCGYGMRSSKSRGRHYLQCQTRYVSKDACIGAFISVDRLEQVVISELQRISKDLLDREALEEDIVSCNCLHEQRRQILKEKNNYQKKIGEYQKGIKNLYLDKARDILSESDFNSLYADFLNEKSRLEGKVISCENLLAQIDSFLASDHDRHALIDRYLNPEHLNRTIVETLIDHIIVKKRIPGTHIVPVEICWNF